MKKAKKMLLAGFLACTMLATGAALVGCGGDSSSGGGDNSSTSTPEAWELGNTSVTYTVDKDGVETAVYTVVSADGEEYTKSVATGRKVVGLDVYNVKINGEEFDGTMIETTVGNEPKVEVLATFDDGTQSWVTITDEMYQGAKPDYTKAGLYSAQIKLVDRLSAPVLVTGDEPVTKQTMLLNEQMGGACVLWNKADVVAGTYDVSTVLWGNVASLNGEETQVIVNATADQIKPIDWTAESEEGIYNFSVTDAAGNSGVLQAYVLDDNSETSVEPVQSMLVSFTMMDQLTALKGSDVSVIDTSNMLANQMLTIGEGAAMAMRIVEVPESAVYTLETSVCGNQALTATWTVNEETVTAMTSVLVYENKEEFAEVQDMQINSYAAVESGVMDMQFFIYSGTQYTAGTGLDKQILGTSNTAYETVALTADMIKGTAPDFTTAGVKVFTVEIGGNEYTYAVELWKEAEKPVATTTNIASIDLPAEITLLKDSVNIELYVRQNFVNQSVMVNYIEPVNMMDYAYATLKADAFDWSAVKMDTVGEYAIVVSYEGYTQEIAVNVVTEMPTEEVLTPVVQLQANYDFALMGLNNGLLGIVLYENNVAEIMDGFSPYYYESVWATYTLDATTGKLELSIDGAKFAIGTVADMDTDGIYDTVVAYTFEGTPTAEVMLEMATPYGGTMPVTVSLYENGYACVMGEWNPESTGNAYTIADGVLTIGSEKWAVVGTGADAQYLTIMSGEY